MKSIKKYASRSTFYHMTGCSNRHFCIIIVIPDISMSITVSLSVTLLDGITGRVLFTCDHKRSSQPVHLVHSENWVVVSVVLCNTYFVGETTSYILLDGVYIALETISYVYRKIDDGFI